MQEEHKIREQTRDSQLKQILQLISEEKNDNLTTTAANHPAPFNHIQYQQPYNGESSSGVHNDLHIEEVHFDNTNDMYATDDDDNSNNTQVYIHQDDNSITSSLNTDDQLSISSDNSFISTPTPSTFSRFMNLGFAFK